MTERLFHLVPGDQAAELRGTYAPASLASEGFVHLSFRAQLQGTLDLHFAGVQRVYVLELEPDRVTGDLRLEPSRGGADFPHLYRALERDDVVAAWCLEAAAPQGLQVPDLERGQGIDLDVLWPL